MRFDLRRRLKKIADTNLVDGFGHLQAALDFSLGSMY